MPVSSCVAGRETQAYGRMDSGKVQHCGRTLGWPDQGTSTALSVPLCCILYRREEEQQADTGKTMIKSLSHPKERRI